MEELHHHEESSGHGGDQVRANWAKPKLVSLIDHVLERGRP